MPTRGKPDSYIYSRTYAIWSGMKTRCLTPGTTMYPTYGGAGIKVSERWKNYWNFLEDMGEAPAGFQIDRYPDPSGNYEPGNCRWATPKQNSRNKRNTLKVTFRGETKALADWAEIVGIPYNTVLRRLNPYKWTVEEALTISPKGTGAKIERIRQNRAMAD